VPFLAKAAISALLLYLSVHRVNFGSVGERLGTLNFGWLVFMLIALWVQTLLLALRWRGIVGICGARLHLTAGFSYSLIGLFFSQVLPSTIGGDAARIWLMARGGAGWPMASYSVLLDRVVGVTVLAILVVVCLPWTLDLIHDPVARATLAMIGFGTLAGAMGFLALGVPSLRVTERLWLIRQLAVASPLAWQLCRSVRAGT
jgi:uncharacterized protein (TIRG00374 family)